MEERNAILHRRPSEANIFVDFNKKTNKKQLPISLFYIMHDVDVMGVR